MFVIRKFVGYTGAAAIGAALALAVQAQTGIAAAPTNRVDEPVVSQFTPSADCLAAINAIKVALRNDADEDTAERQAVRLDPTAAETPGEDSGEVATLQGLFSDARTKCAPAIAAATGAPTIKTFTPTGPCADAIHALKTAWAAGRPTTQAQWQNLQSLAQTVRSACGWSWSPER